MTTTALMVANRVTDILKGQTTAQDRVFLDFVAALDRDESPSIVVEQESDNSESFAENMDKSELKFKVVLVTRSHDWQTDLDPVRERVHQLIIGDVELNRLLKGLRRTSMVANAANADVPFGSIEQQYRGLYISSNNQLNGEISGS